MKKIIHRVGNSIGIIFNAEDREIYGLKDGIIIEIKIQKVVKK